MKIKNETIKKLTTIELCDLGARQLGFQFFATKRKFKKRLDGIKLVFELPDEVVYENDFYRFEFIKPHDVRFNTWIYRQYDKIKKEYMLDVEPYSYVPFLRA